MWISGSVCLRQNERCDELATTAADGDRLLEDRAEEEKVKIR